MSCECYAGFVCQECTHKLIAEAEARNESDDNVYKFTLNIKNDMPYSSKLFGTYVNYESAVAVAYRTHKQLTQDIMDFNEKGGKVTGIQHELAFKQCRLCHSSVLYRDYNFEHDMCNTCVDEHADIITQRIKDKIETLMLVKFLNYKPSINSQLK